MIIVSLIRCCYLYYYVKLSACLFVFCLLPINSAFYGLPPHIIHNLNQHDPGSALVCNNPFALTVC